MREPLADLTQDPILPFLFDSCLDFLLKYRLEDLECAELTQPGTLTRECRGSLNIITTGGYFEPVLWHNSVVGVMAEKTELETETNHAPEQATAMLRTLADEIDAGDEITVEGNSGSITVPGTLDKIKTELEAEHEIKGDYDQVEVEIELGWTIVPDADEE